MPYNTFQTIFLDLPSFISSAIFLCTGCMLNTISVFTVISLLDIKNRGDVSLLRNDFSILLVVLQIISGLLVLIVGLLGLMVSCMFLSKRAILVILLLTSLLALLSLICIIVGIVETKNFWDKPALSVPRFANIIIHFINMVCAISLCVTLIRRVHNYQHSLTCRYDSFKMPVMLLAAVLLTSSIASLSAFSAGVLISKTDFGLTGGLHTGFLSFITGLLILLNQRLIANQDTTIACIVFCAITVLSSSITAYSETIELQMQNPLEPMFYPKVGKSATIYFAALLNVTIMGPLLLCLVLRLWQISLIYLQQAVSNNCVILQNPPFYELINVNYLDSPQNARPIQKDHEQQLHEQPQIKMDETDKEQRRASPRNKHKPLMTLCHHDNAVADHRPTVQTLPNPKRRSLQQSPLRKKNENVCDLQV